MKLIIAGSRTIVDYSVVENAIKQSGWVNEITTIISGCAKGVDKLGEMYAHNHKIPIARFPAEWERFGKSAGFIRNIRMAEFGDRLIAIQQNNSTGTGHMIRTMLELRKLVFVVTYNHY